MYANRSFRSEERFSRNAETDIVCRLLLEKIPRAPPRPCPARLRPPHWRRPTPLGSRGALRRRRHAGPPATPPCEPPPSPRHDFFFNDPAPPEIYPLPLHAPLPI